MPLHRRLPKRGFNNIFAKKYNELNLGRIQEAVDSGRLDGKKPITIEALKEAGLIRRAKDGVRLLGHGEIKAKLAFEITGASASAIKAVEAKGGSVTLEIHHRPRGTRRRRDQGRTKRPRSAPPKPRPRAARRQRPRRRGEGGEPEAKAGGRRPPSPRRKTPKPG